MMEFFTLREVADALHLHPNTLKRLIKKGELVGYRVGSRGDWRIRGVDVNRFLEERRVG